MIAEGPFKKLWFFSINCNLLYTNKQPAYYIKWKKQYKNLQHLHWTLCASSKTHKVVKIITNRKKL